jgi:murein DD-endopeptidase MepM/ murein hydrolase activator NlpD
VAIGDYRANFSSLDEVKEFLDEVKAPSDEGEEYQTGIYSKDSHVSGILCAKLVKCNPEEVNEPEVTLAEETGSGVSQAFAYAVSYAAANPDDGSYKTGILDMEFMENVEVYENYVEASQMSDIASEVIEVTKEKESNKIYVVQSGDCLSVIAMDHDTTVSSIMALNGMSNADAIIRDGQELIIAVPEPELKLRITMGEVYEEDYNEDPVIIENDSWYTTKEVVLEEGTTGHRERNDVVVYENGVEASREMLHENIMVASTAAVIEKGTIIPPTYIKPLSGGHYTSGFGYRWGRLHKGVDWGCPVGTTVYASCGGTVIQAAYSGGYGNVVVISHPDGRMTRYAHNSKLLVKAGQHVEQGEAIALSGSTGNSTGPHVHFEIYINGSAVNPLNYISY